MSEATASIIRAGRAAKGWTQEEFARLTNVNVQSVRNWEKGADPRPPKWAEITEALGEQSSAAPLAPARGIAEIVAAHRQELAAEIGVLPEAIRITIDL